VVAFEAIVGVETIVDFDLLDFVRLFWLLLMNRGWIEFER
jgi:hypothetical protein